MDRTQPQEYHLEYPTGLAYPANACSQHIGICDAQHFWKDGQFRVTLEWNGSIGLVLGAVAIVGRLTLQSILVQAILVQTACCRALSNVWRNATQGMVFSPNPFRLARCGLRATSAVRTVAEASAAALFEEVAWLVASTFGVTGRTNSPEVASWQCASFQSRRSEGSSAHSGREVGDRAGRAGRDSLRGGSGVAFRPEGCQTRCTRTPACGFSGGVSGMRQTVIGQVGSIGTGTTQRTERGGRRIGSRGEVPRRDVLGSS